MVAYALCAVVEGGLRAGYAEMALSTAIAARGIVRQVKTSKAEPLRLSASTAKTSQNSDVNWSADYRR